MKIQRFYITEAHDHWVVVGPGFHETFRAAGDALQAVQEVGQLLAARDQVSSMITIEWACSSKIGRQVVRALQL
jgi:hypothetical protein